MRKLGLCWCVILLIVTCVQAQFTMPEAFQAQAYANALGETLPVRVWRNGTGKLPLIVLLHGSGECGTNNVSQLQMFKPLYQQLLVKETPVQVAIPQCTQRNAWVRTLAFAEDYRLPRYPAPALRILKDYIDDEVKAGRVDPNRIYLMGVSLGGFGTWDAVERWPNYFAAAVPICGGGSTQPSALEAVGTSNVWVFHGEKDTSVPVTCARRMVTALEAMKIPVRYHEYPENGHHIWNAVLSNPKVLAWLLEQRLGQQPNDTQTRSREGFFGQLIDYFTPGKN